MTIENAVARSISHTEIGYCEFRGDIGKLEDYISDAFENGNDAIFSVENDGTIDVADCDDEWRIRVTLVEVVTYRNELLTLAQRLGVTDEMAGEEYWQQYLTVEQIEETTVRLFRDRIDNDTRVIAGVGADEECGSLDSVRHGMALVRLDQGTVSSVPISDIDTE